MSRASLGPLTLESGAELPELEVDYETYGDYDGSNAVVVCHALTGDAHVTDWWGTLVGPGLPVDTDRFHVICANLLGGCKGTTGPSSIDPRTGEPYGDAFPLVTMRDLAEVHRRLVREHLGITHVYAGIGSSLGGMQILQWALDHPGELDIALLICASARLTAQNRAFSKVARTAIAAGGVDPGMALARMLAHITYLSEEGMQRKFGNERRDPTAPMTRGSDFEVEHYLDHQAEIFLKRFDPGTYVVLSRVMDYFDPFADPSADVGDTRYRLLSFDSDWRFGTSHSLALLDELRRRGADATHQELRTPWGHDAFLMADDAYHAAVRSSLTDTDAQAR